MPEATAPEDITARPAHAQAQAIASGELSCREMMQACLTRIDALNPRFLAIVSLRPADELLREADAADAVAVQARRRHATASKPLGTLHGLPQAIKDLAHATGLPTTQGSPLTRHFMPAADSLIVQRVKAAGAIVIGKTNVPEFGLGSHSFNPVFGTTRNAWDPSKTAGGSSGGAAVALALRLLPVADGSDFMGSLRNPAAWNHVFGLRPSQGRVPAWPVPDVWVAQLGTEGPMARTVRDLARLLDVQAGPDARLPLSIATREHFEAALAEPPPQGVRVGWLGDLHGHLATEPGVLATCEAALRTLQGAGCHVEPAALGFSPERVWNAWRVWRRWLTAGRLAPLAEQPGGRAQMKPEALWEIDQAAGLTGAEVMAASAERSAFFEHMRSLFERFDVLALPSAQVWPFALEERWPTHIAGRTMDTYHRWMETTIYATFAGLPALSVPAGFNDAGLPMGLQLIGRPQGERALLQLAQAYEHAAAALLARRPAEAFPA